MNKEKDLVIALNSLRFNYRMWKRKEREFISDKLLELDFNVLNSIYEKNSKAFSLGEDIITAERIGDRFETKVVSASDENYVTIYNSQKIRFENWLKACKMIQNYVKSFDEEVEDMMGEIHQKIDLSTDTKVTEDVKENGENDVDELIENLSKKVQEFNREFSEPDRKNKLSDEDYDEIFKLYEAIDEINYYYSKLEKLSNSDDILNFYEDNLDYIEDDLNISLDYLNSKLTEYRKLHEEKKPFLFSAGEESKYYTAKDDDYELAFNYMLSTVDVAISKAKILKDKNFAHDILVEPVRDHAMEMIFNEQLDIIDFLDERFKAGDAQDRLNISVSITWIRACNKIINNLKEKLEADYNSGNKIKCARLEDGRYVVTEEENTLENYQSQMKLLNKIIEDCAIFNQKLNELKNNQEFSEAQFDSEKTENVETNENEDINEEAKVDESSNVQTDNSKSDKQDIDSKYVVVQNNGRIVVIASDMKEEDLKSLDSDLIREAGEKGMDIEFSVNLGAGLQNVGGILLEVAEDGTITLGGNIEKAEFHNQAELIKTYEDVKTENVKVEKGTLNDEDIVQTLMDAKENDNILEVERILDNNPSIIWSKVSKEIVSGKLSADEAQSLIDYVIAKYDSEKLRSNYILDNIGYQSLIKTIKANNREPFEMDKTKVLKPLDVREARKVVKRKKNNRLIDKFKKLKKWQKVAIVTGLTLAGVAVIGVGVHCLVPEVREMVDEFIKNLNIPNIGKGAPDVISQIAPVKQPEIVGNVNPTNLNVDYSPFVNGHTVYADAYSAASGINPLDATSYFNNNPLDVFNVDTNQFMHLTSEQLHNPEFLQSLASDPNNTMLFGTDMAHPDGFVPLQEIIGEAIKGGKVL